MIDAKSYLQQVEKLDMLITNKLIERQQWKDIALGITASVGGERVQSSSSQQRMADAVVKIVDIESEIDGLIDAFITTKKMVIATIEKLHSPTEYNILHMRYIQHISLIEIADMLNKEYSWVTTTHGRAVKNVQNILNKR
jgi:DNA-directed RNA polymerase specialized sigma subunit